MTASIVADRHPLVVWYGNQIADHFFNRLIRDLG
jgi:hypothetical protein